MLAEGDVDPAAGSRDEPTRLPVEAPVAERKQAFEVQVTRALFLKSNIGGAASPADPKRSHYFGTRGDPKTRQKNVEKTEGPNGGSKVEIKGAEL